MCGSNTSEDSPLSSWGRRYRLSQSFCMPLVYMCLGVVTTIVSPTIIDMTRLFKCNYEEYSRALMMKSFGVLIGSFIGGLASDRHRRHINVFIFINTLVFGLTSIGMPWYPSLVLLGALYSLLGFGHGCMSVATNSYSIAVWAERAPLPIHSLHVAYTSCQVLGPIISEPFVTPIGLNMTNINLNASSVYAKPSELIYMPYLICGLISCAVSILFLVLTFIPIPEELVSKEEEPKALGKIFSLAACGGDNVFFASFWVTCLFFVYVVHVSRMNSIITFLYPMAVETATLHFSHHEATLLQTVFYISGAVGRLICALLSLCVSVKITLFIFLIAALGAYSGLTFLGLSQKYMFWIWICSAIFLAAPVYPTVMAWADRYIEVTGLVVAVIDTGIGVGIFMSTWVSGVIYHRAGAQDLLYFCFSCATCVCIIVTIMQITGAIHGDRYKKTMVNANVEIEKDSENVSENKPLIN